MAWKSPATKWAFRGTPQTCLRPSWIGPRDTSPARPSQTKTAGCRSRRLRKTIGHLPDKKPLKALAKLDELLSTHYIGPETPRNKGENVSAMHRLVALADLDGVPHRVKIIVMEDNNGNRFYDHHVLEEK